jgi:hypothetical protein
VAQLVFNVAKGRVVELYNRVKSNDPATSAIVVIPIEETGLETDDVLKDKDTLADVLSGTTNEQTTMGRKVLTDADLDVLPVPDDTNDLREVGTPDIIWAAAAGNPISKLLVCYDPDTGGGTDANIVPLTMVDFVVEPSGVDIQANASSFYRAM